MNGKLTSTVAGASVFITVFGLISRSLGIVRESIYAGYFGLSIDYDLYLIGAVLPITINTIILYVGQNYFIPKYNEQKSVSEDTAAGFTNSTFWMFTLSAAVFALLLFLSSDFLLKLYIHGEVSNHFDTTLLIFRIFLITIPISSAISVLAAYQQAEFEFKFPVLAQLFLNLSVIATVLVFSDVLGIIAIPLGYVAGTFLQLIFLYSKSREKISLRIYQFLQKRKYGLLGPSFIFLIIIETMGQLFLIADRYLYNYVEKGGIAALNYAFNIFNLPVSIFAVALATALFPRLSKLSSGNSNEEVGAQIRHFFSINLFIFIAISFVFIFFGNVIIMILFERGQFTSSSTAITYNALKIYSLSLIFFSTYSIFNKLMYSYKFIRALFYITIAGIILKVTLNFILAPVIAQAGLALSTSVTYLFFFVSSFAFLLIKLNKLWIYPFLKEFSFGLLNGFISLSVVFSFRSIGLINNTLTGNLFYLIIFILLYITNAVVIKHNSIIKLKELLFNIKQLKQKGWQNL